MTKKRITQLATDEEDMSSRDNLQKPRDQLLGGFHMTTNFVKSPFSTRFYAYLYLERGFE